MLIAELAPAINGTPLTVQRIEDYFASQTITCSDKIVHPDDVERLQVRLDRVAESVGLLIGELHDDKGDQLLKSGSLLPQAGDFEIEGGRLELHGMLLDSVAPYHGGSKNIEARRVTGHLITADSGIYRHTGTRYYGGEGNLLTGSDTLRSLTPQGRIGRVSNPVFAEIDMAVVRGEQAVTNLGNRFGIVTPVFEAREHAAKNAA